MRILLITPPIEDFFFTPQRAYPLGLLYLAAALKEAGHTVKVINCPHDYKRITLAYPKEFKYLLRYYHPNRSPFSLFNHYYGYGSDYPRLKKDIIDFKPDIVGLSANFSAYLDPVFETARLVKNIDKKITIIAGGRAATVSPQLLRSGGFIDYVLRGEAEGALVDLVAAIEKNGRRVGAPRGMHYHRDLDHLAFPARELIDGKTYIFRGKVSISLMASRGCGLKCAFCAIRDKFRYRSVKNILDEMEDCYGQGVRHFNFEDDNINFHPHLNRLLEEIIRRFRPKITISFMNGILSRGITRGLGQKLIEAGLTHVDFSAATCDQALAAKVNRREKLSDVINACRFMAKNKITSTVHFILGMPGQDFASVAADIHLLAREPLFLGPSIFYPVAESDIFKAQKGKAPFRLKDYSFFRSSVAAYDGAISRDRIFTLFYACRIVNFIKQHGARGDILLDKLFTSGKIFRTDGTDYIEEEFVKSEDLRLIFDGLKISPVTFR